jgi:hypothetical protein
LNTKLDENQHYVPRLLLGNFSVPLKQTQVMVFDKQTEKTFPRSDGRSFDCSSGTDTGRSCLKSELVAGLLFFPIRLLHA